jgi:hypothetical protein
MTNERLTDDDDFSEACLVLMRQRWAEGEAVLARGECIEVSPRDLMARIRASVGAKLQNNDR